MPQSTAVYNLTIQQRLQQMTANIVYTKDEQEALALYLDRINNAVIQRSQPRAEFDNLTYEQDYIANERAAYSFLRLKKNDDEIRIVTGVTEKKIESVANELKAMFFDFEINAFDDQDNELTELGWDFTDIVRRTNEQERDEDLEDDIIAELLTQRAVFIQDVVEYETIYDKYYDDEGNLLTEKRIIKRLHKELLSGLQVYLGDINLPAYQFNKQPYIVIYERIPYDRAKILYGHLKNWKYVKAGNGSSNWYHGLFDYRVSKLYNNEVEVLHYKSFPEDEYQIIINGVMMLPLGTKLSYEHNGYDITMVVPKPIKRKFAYGKCLVASAKTLQALSDESIRLLIYKFRQALKPPLASRNNQILDGDIFAPAKITMGISKEDFEPLITHNGITNSDIEMYERINDLTKEFIGSSDLMSGIPTIKSMSATETIKLIEQGIKMLGYSVSSYMRLKRNLIELRLFNILQHYTEPLGLRLDIFNDKLTKSYRRFTINNSLFEDGTRGKKIIQFMDRNLTHEERVMIYKYEQKMLSKGKPIRYKIINVNLLRNFGLLWYINIIAKDKENSAIQRLMFKDKLENALIIASQSNGKIQIDWDEIRADFGRKWQAPNMLISNNQYQDYNNINLENPEINRLMKNISSIDNIDISKELLGGELAPNNTNKQMNNTI